MNDNLPPLMREIVGLVGLGPAIALSRAYPGIALRVPTGALPHGDTRAGLVRLMGEAAAGKFVAHFGGERLTIPKCEQALRYKRDRRIIIGYTVGQSVMALAREHDLSERQIRTILKRSPGEDVKGLGAAGEERQGALF